MTFSSYNFKLVHFSLSLERERDRATFSPLYLGLSFVLLLGPEKKGKTINVLKFSSRGIKQSLRIFVIQW